MITNNKIYAFGNKFSNRLENQLIEGALNYINHGESGLAFEILCDHLVEKSVCLSSEEYNQAMELISDLQLDPGRTPFVHLGDLII